MRQLRIITKTPDTEQVMLEPGVHGALYNIPEVREARDVIEKNPAIEMLGIRIGARYYSLVVSHEDTLQPQHFQLDE
jgi:hypothetical protein